MKIISKYKDYYDYLKGVYGEDIKLVLDRRKGSAKPFVYHRNGVIQLFICGFVVEGFGKNGKYYWGKELNDIAEKDFQIHYYDERGGVTHVISDGTPKRYNWHRVRGNLIPDITQLNMRENCPIIIRHYSEVFIMSKLQDIGVSKVLDAKTIWLMLSEWLGQRITASEPRVPIGDDKLRLLAHGYDLKTSFRGKKK